MPEHYDVKPSLLHQLKLRANYRLLATQFDKTVAVSADIKKSLMRDYGIPESRLETIHNGIAVPEYQPRSVKRDEFVIGSAGRFFPVKDYPLMVEVANEVCAKTDEIRFELAGEGPMQEAIQSLISKHGLEKRFLLRGFISDVDAFCRQLDVYINTSLHEGIPMSVLEAMAHGVPPILPKVGGLEEIVTDGVDGYLVATRSPQEFADRCLSLFRNEELRRNMARAAREKVIGEFSIERMIHAYVEMYRQLIENSGQRKHQ
jgi:glycosyltransferase involved in cell wall biosynthesis